MVAAPLARNHTQLSDVQLGIDVTWDLPKSPYGSEVMITIALPCFGDASSESPSLLGVVAVDLVKPRFPPLPPFLPSLRSLALVPTYIESPALTKVYARTHAHTHSYSRPEINNFTSMHIHVRVHTLTRFCACTHSTHTRAGSRLGP
jgi:hypothetical protein